MMKVLNNVYYLEFIVMNDQIVPKNPENFIVKKGEDKYTKIYQLKNSFFSDKQYVKTIDIDFFTTHFPCKEALTNFLFLNVSSYENDIVPFVQLYKYQMGSSGRKICVGETKLDIIYEDTMLREILNELREGQRETLPIDSTLFLEYFEYFAKLVDNTLFRNFLIDAHYVGYKMASVLKQYNGTYQSLFKAKQYLRNYYILRGVHCAARKKDPKLLEQQELFSDQWLSSQEQHQRFLKPMSYFDRLRYTGELKQLRESIMNGTIDLDDIPIKEDEFGEYIDQLLQKYKAAMTDQDKEMCYQLLSHAMSFPRASEKRFSELKHLLASELNQIDQVPFGNFSFKHSLKQKISYLQTLESAEERQFEINEIMGMLEMATSEDPSYQRHI